MTRLTVDHRPVDKHRGIRLLLAWVSGDQLALNVVLGEVMADEVGVPGLLFVLTEYAARIGEAAAPDFADQLRTQLLEDQADDQADEQP